MIKRSPILVKLITLGLIAAVPLLALLGYNTYRQYQAQQQEATNTLDTLRQSVERQVTGYLGDVQSILRHLAQHPALMSGEWDQVGEKLRETLAPRPDLSNLAVLDQEGHIRAAVRFLPADPTITLRPLAWYREGLDADGFHISQPFQGTITKQWTCVVSYPVVDATGRRIATLAAPLNLLELSRRFFFETPNAISIISVIDRSGILLMRSFEAEKSIGTSSDQIQAAFARRLTGSNTGEMIGRDNRPRIYSLEWIKGTTWALGVTMPKDVIFASANANLRRSLLSLGGLALILALVVPWLARDISRPIASLADAARAQMLGRTGPPAIEAGSAEIADTARAFNEMVATRRAIEQSLQESEHRYRTAIDQTGQMIYEVDIATGRIAWFGSQAVERTTGYTLAEFPVADLAGCEAFTHPDDRAAASARFEECLATGELYHMEYRFRQKDGSYRNVEDHGVFLLDPAGRPVRMLGRMSDITDRKRAEAALRASEERTRQIIDSALDAVITMDEKGVIAQWNAQAEAIFGWSRTEAVGRRLSEVIVSPRLREAHEHGLRRYLATREPRLMGRRIEIEARHRAGHEFPVELSLVALPQGDTLHFGAFMRDLTEWKRAEAERLAFERKIQETQKLESLGVLAGGIAHDFNNLLTGILGNASLARMDLPPGSPLLSIVGQIEQSAHGAAELCKQMLAYSGKGRFVVQRLDLNQLIGDATPLLNLSISKHCLIRFHPAAPLPAVMADATQIQQIIMNLVINASEAIGERNGLIRLGTSVVDCDRNQLATLLHAEGAAPGSFVQLEVADDGAGMDATTVARIFEPFFTTKFTGRGLGLAAVLGIIRGHKGALHVASEPGRGTTFRILLPSAEGPAEPAPRPGPADDTKWRGRGTVLVVDDEETVRTVSARILESIGFSVVLAADGREAVEIYGREPARYALVLLDLTMPQMGGEDAFRELRRRNPGVKVVLMSGFNEQEAISRFIGQGLAGFVQKPFEVTGIVRAVRQVFRSS